MAKNIVPRSSRDRLAKRSTKVDCSNNDGWASSLDAQLSPRFAALPDVDCAKMTYFTNSLARAGYRLRRFGNECASDSAVSFGLALAGAAGTIVTAWLLAYVATISRN
jgi:hypothetical protein